MRRWKPIIPAPPSPCVQWHRWGMTLFKSSPLGLGPFTDIYNYPGQSRPPHYHHNLQPVFQGQLSNDTERIHLMSVWSTYTTFCQKDRKECEERSGACCDKISNLIDPRCPVLSEWETVSEFRLPFVWLWSLWLFTDVTVTWLDL